MLGFTFFDQSANPAICRPPYLAVGRGVTKKGLTYAKNHLTCPVSSYHHQTPHHPDRTGSAIMSKRTAPKSLHQGFSWSPDHHQNQEAAELYALTKDVCHGIQLSIDLAHFSTMDRNSDTTPVLNIADTETLLRFTLTLSQMLGSIAELRIDQLDRSAINWTEPDAKAAS